MISWLGVGAQRSGTTWLIELLTQHPEFNLGKSGQKELHILDQGDRPGTPPTLSELGTQREFAGSFGQMR